MCVVPRVEALGCFLFARRALGTRTRKCPNSRALRAVKPALTVRDVKKLDKCAEFFRQLSGLENDSSTLQLNPRVQYSSIQQTFSPNNTPIPQYPGTRVQTTGRFEVEDFAIQIQIAGLLSYLPPGRFLGGALGHDPKSLSDSP